MPSKGRRVDRVAEDEVHLRWSALSVEQRRELLRFDEPVLVDRIRSGLQVLYERQDMMQSLGINLGSDGGSDPFETSLLLKDAFMFTWDIGRLAKDPSVCVVDPTRSAVMVMKAEFVASEDFFEIMRGVVPDFLSPKSVRNPLSRVRWKEIWATEPASMHALEERLAKLVEQALWAMGADPEYAVPADEEVAVDVQLEPWMTEHDDEVAKAREAAKKKKKRKQKPRITLLAPTPEETGKASRDDEDNEEDPVEIAEPEGSADSRRNSKDYSGSSQPPSESPEVSATYFKDEDTEATESTKAQTETASVPPEEEEIDVATVFNRPPDAEVYCMHEDTTGRTPGTPPPSPTGGHRTWKPPELVNYIWGQTAILQGASREACGETPTIPVTRSTETPTSVPASFSTTECGTPWSRGHWSLQQQSTPIGLGNTCRAVVRNTFIDIDVGSNCSTPATTRSSRSLSPSSLRSGKRGNEGPNDQWMWYWH